MRAHPAARNPDTVNELSATAAPANSAETCSRSELTAAPASFATPIPLYEIYRKPDGVPKSGLSLTAAVYLLAAVGALLVPGRLSNYAGRRPMPIAALALAAAGGTVPLDVHAGRRRRRYRLRGGGVTRRARQGGYSRTPQHQRGSGIKRDPTSTGVRYDDIIHGDRPAPAGVFPASARRW